MYGYDSNTSFLGPHCGFNQVAHLAATLDGQEEILLREDLRSSPSSEAVAAFDAFSGIIKSRACLPILPSDSSRCGGWSCRRAGLPICQNWHKQPGQ